MTDPLEWLYADSRVKEQRTFSETDVPANGVAGTLDGYLHWGYNQFSPKNNPLRTSLSRDEHMSSNLLPGDRNIVYDGTDWPSVRLEAMRQSFEDLELLRIQAKRNRTSAEALVKRLMNVGVANITDTGWKDDVHSHDKKPVGNALRASPVAGSTATGRLR